LIAAHASAEKCVHDHELIAAIECFRVLERMHAGRERDLALRERVLCAREHTLDDSHAHSGGMKRVRNDPSVAAIVSRPRRHDNARRDSIAKPLRDLCRGGGTSALHQRARRNA
jgi:hypothetical protein